MKPKMKCASQSTVSTLPFGSNVHPSSSFISDFVAVPVSVQVIVERFNSAACLLILSWSMKVPSGSTTLHASPIGFGANLARGGYRSTKNGGGATDTQELLTGSYIAPWLVRVKSSLTPVYSPPSIITRPS